jgi:methyltransferase (TIGR00027 family)
LIVRFLAAGPLAPRGREWGVDRRGRPSLTARNVATIRLALGRPALASGDPEGEDRLARSLRAPLPWQLPGMAAYIAARTEFFDNRLLQACERGCQQVVIVGAGYDGRSLRFRQPGVTFYEVDHPTTQADKLARLGEVAASAEEVRFVAADIRRDSVVEALTMAGHDRRAATHFMCEGLTSYLPMALLSNLLRSLGCRAAPRSTIAIDFVAPARDRSTASWLLLRLVRAGTALMGERMVTVVTAEEAASLLRDTGWHDVEVTRPGVSMPVALTTAVIR